MPGASSAISSTIPRCTASTGSAVRKHYEKMLEDCVSREDVGYVISEMIAEINVGHAYYREGDVEDEPKSQCRYAGMRIRAAQGRLPDRPICTKVPSGMSMRGIHCARRRVKSGEYLLAVNRVPLDMDRGIRGLPFREWRTRPWS